MEGEENVQRPTSNVERRTTERPILFSATLVQATLGGRKTQTRRVIKPQPPKWEPLSFTKDVWTWRDSADRVRCCISTSDCPYGQPGDRLYVKEALKRCGKWAFYEQDGTAVQVGNHDSKWEWNRPLLPARFMPRWASRITLEIVSVRVERLQEISEEDATAEGMAALPNSDWYPTWRQTFLHYWDSLNAKRGYGWNKNPSVWVIEYPAFQSAIGNLQPAMES